MTANDSLVTRLIVVIKQHKKPSSAKSIAVLLKRMDVQILQPNRTVEEFKAELRAALASTTVLSETVRQQHSEEELRACFTELLLAMDAPPEVEGEEEEQETEKA